MGCKVVYGIVPRDGETLEELGEERFWRKALKSRDQGSGIRDQDESGQLSVISDQGDSGQVSVVREQDGAFSSQLSAISSGDLVRLEPGSGEIGEESEAVGLGAWDPAIDGGSDSLMEG
jgi:hypothetical protein